jgi:phage terminase large subunit
MQPNIDLPEKLVDVFTGDADYRVAWGGRGSGKTRGFAIMAAVKALQWAAAGKTGVIVCAREFMNSLADSSMAEVKAAILSHDWLTPYFDIGESYIRTADGRVQFLFLGLRRNIASLKSTANILLLWVDEADPVPEKSWETVIPTVREEGSEIWVTWNPENKNSATHKRFRLNPPDRCKGVEINWKDNPFFPSILHRTRLEDKAKRPEQYAHVWEGDFVSVAAGAYYASSLLEAKAEGRIGVVPRDKTLPVRAAWDIGVRDACAIWIYQHVGDEIRFLNHYEAIGQPLDAHLDWLRENKYSNAICILPHDGAHHDAVTATRFADHVMGAGFDVEVIPNQGKGAALRRVEAARKLFPAMRFNQAKCQGGLDALGWYHEKIDDQRNIGLGPEHDWASHSADAFGLAAVAYEKPSRRGLHEQRVRKGIV